jgi:pimeloyl-ACP methyl ester carboxylesterase
MLRNRLRRGYVSPERGSHSIDQYLRPLSNGTGRHTLLAQSGALDANFISESALRSVNVPTAIIWGADDPYRPSANAAWLAERIHGATLEVIPGARHFVPEEDYQCVARVVADLLER